MYSRKQIDQNNKNVENNFNNFFFSPKQILGLKFDKYFSMMWCNFTSLLDIL